jgi:DNA-binding NtrC family response regulator
VETRTKRNGKLKVLCLEDSPQDVEIMRALLTDAGFDLEMDCTEAEKEFTSFLRSHTYDIILADFKLPGFDAFAALRWVMEICPNVPFVCVSGSIGEEAAVELLKKGAVDYVLKDRLERLPFAIQRALDEAKEKDARKRAEEDLQEATIEREKLIKELQHALANIKTLQGLIPICANCKNIRDDKGFWNQVESYISEHTDAEFTHGVCPECAKKLYGDLYEKTLEKQDKKNM